MFWQVLGFNLMESGMFSVLPWLTMALSANLGGWIADTLVSRDVSVTVVRKVCFLSCWLTANTANPNFTHWTAQYLQDHAILVSSPHSSQSCAQGLGFKELHAFSFSGFRMHWMDILTLKIEPTDSCSCYSCWRFSHELFVCMWFSFPDHAKHWILGSCFFPHSTHPHSIASPCCLVHDVLTSTVSVPFVVGCNLSLKLAYFILEFKVRPHFCQGSRLVLRLFLLFHYMKGISAVCLLFPSPCTLLHVPLDMGLWPWFVIVTSFQFITHNFLFCNMQGCDAFSQSGLYSNHQDIGPRYSVRYSSCLFCFSAPTSSCGLILVVCVVLLVLQDSLSKTNVTAMETLCGWTFVASLLC